MQEQMNTEVAVLAPASRAAMALGSASTETKLRDLATKSAAIVNVIDIAGRTEAHQAGMNLRNARTNIDKTGKAARDDANAFCKAVIAEEKRLIGIIEPEEKRVLGLRDAFDAECAAKKAEADRIEAERKAGIKAKIEAIRNIPLGMADATAFDIAAEREALETFNADEQFAEFITDAQDAIMSAIGKLGDLYAAAMAREEEARRQVELAEANRVAALEIERQRAELLAQQQEAARVAAEQEAERQRVAAAALAEQQRQQAETKRQLDAMQAEIAAERKAAADKQAAERVAFEEEKRQFEEKLKAQADADARRKAEKEEADRVAAMPVERVVEILEAAPAVMNRIAVPPSQDIIFDLAAAEISRGPEVDLVQVTETITDAVDDFAEVTAFRAAVRDLLMTRTADEVEDMLSEEIERFMSLVAA